LNLNSAEILANQLLAQYNLEEWKFKFDHARLRFGCCDFGKKTISLSRVLSELNSAEKVQDVLLHEIAHALVGKKHAHGKVWQEKAIEIGCNPKRCYLPSEIKTPISKYTVNCMKCGKNFQASRRRKNAACRSCCKQFNNGRYSNKFLVVFEEN
jgi:predicted SprT family Zn-dependent metalloprotease